MSLEIETKQAVAALQAAAKECGDVLALCDNKTPETTEGRGYAYIAARLDDGMRVINNVLRDIGESPSLPAARAPETVVETETVTETVTVDNPETQQRLDDALAKIEELEKLLAEAAKPHPAEQMLDQMPDNKIFDVDKIPKVVLDEMDRENIPHGQQQAWLWKKYQAVQTLMFMNQEGYNDLHVAMHNAMYKAKNAAVEVL